MFHCVTELVQSVYVCGMIFRGMNSLDIRIYIAVGSCFFFIFLRFCRNIYSKIAL